MVREETKNSRYLTTSLLLGILVITALLRIPYLGKIPNGFTPDEAAIGYDAYSLLKTGRDHHGDFLPLFAKALGEYGESTYRFITVPFIKIFGLNEFATRLPAAITGILTVFVLYLLTKEIFDKKIALVAALLAGINPWLIQVSRFASHCNLLLLFFCLGLLHFYKGLKNPKYFLLSAVMFALSLHTMIASRVFVPVFIAGIIVIFWDDIYKKNKYTLAACTILVSVFIPLAIYWISPKGMARAQYLLVTSPEVIIHNYLSYFSPKFLFITGDDHLRHSIKDIGQLYVFELLTISVGAYYLIKDNKKKYTVLFLWLVLYPIPAALTAPKHAIRAIIGAPLFVILSSYGIYVLANKCKAKTSRLSLFIGGSMVIVFSLLIYCKYYFVDYPKYYTIGWLYGMREAISYAEKSEYQRIIISKNVDFQYIFVLFYTKYPPSLYHNEPHLDLNPDTWNHWEDSIGKYRIGPISKHFKSGESSLFIVKPYDIDDLPEGRYNINVVHVITAPSGHDVIKLVEIECI